MDSWTVDACTGLARKLENRSAATFEHPIYHGNWLKSKPVSSMAALSPVRAAAPTGVNVQTRESHEINPVSNAHNYMRHNAVQLNCKMFNQWIWFEIDFLLMWSKHVIKSIPAIALIYSIIQFNWRRVGVAECQWNWKYPCFSFRFGCSFRTCSEQTVDFFVLFSTHQETNIWIQSNFEARWSFKCMDKNNEDALFMNTARAWDNLINMQIPYFIHLFKSNIGKRFADHLN